MEIKRAKQVGIVIRWDEANLCVQATGQGFIEGEALRVPMNQGLELLKEKKASRWLADMREQKVLVQADQDWTVQDWTPRAVSTGLKKSAFVIPESALGQLTLKKITSRVGEYELKMAYFSSLEEARKWLNAR